MLFHVDVRGGDGRPLPSGVWKQHEHGGDNQFLWHAAKLIIISYFYWASFIRQQLVIHFFNFIILKDTNTRKKKSKKKFEKTLKENHQTKTITHSTSSSAG